MTSRPTYSCIRCADRKVKCDRQKPCSACIKHNVDCIFRPSPPLQKRQKVVRKQLLTDQRRHYEALLQYQGMNLSRLPNTPDSALHVEPRPAVASDSQGMPIQTPSSSTCESSRSINKTRVVHGQGRSKVINNTLWTRIVEEFHDPEDALEDLSSESSDQEASDDGFGFVLLGESKLNTKSWYPLPERILQLWQVFVESVHPLTKVIHVPTIRPAMQKAASNVGTVPRSFEALMFAIFSMAVVALKDDECRERLCEPRKTLLVRYISVTKAALSQANFMGTTSVVVLQALLLHILSVQEIYQPRTVWSLSGVAIRLAQRMGLERDGAHLSLPPFETEMRRRIWWLLKSHDLRTAELCGLAKFQDMDTDADSTKWPSNLNDNQLHLGMHTLPAEVIGLTDSSFVTLKFEFAAMVAASVARFRKNGKIARDWETHVLGDDKEAMAKAFRELEERIETKYIRYCDPTQPLHLMIMLGARYAMNVVRFMTRHPRRWASMEQVPVAEQEQVWEISVNLLEQHNMVQSNSQLKQFAWHAGYFMHWHAFIHLLDTLRVTPLMDGSDKAWQLIETAYKNNLNMIHATKESIHAAVGNLCLKAYSAREAALNDRHVSLSPVPNFILKLRHQHEIAKARRQARDLRVSQLGYPTDHSHANVGGVSPQPDAGAISSIDALELLHFEEGTAAHIPSPIRTREVTEYDPFWVFNRLDDDQARNSYNVMDMDVDFLPAKDDGVEGNAASNVNWDQWDAWLTSSETMDPILST